MVIPPKKSDDDELSYEDFDDAAWTDDTELEVIDLDALDADIPGEEEKNLPEPDQAAASLLETIDTLDDALAPAAESTEETPPAESATAPVEAAPETAPEPVAAPEPEPPAEPIPEPAAESGSEPETTVKADEPVSESETTAEAVEAAPESPAEPETPPEPVIPPEVYCVLLPLPPELASQVIKLRKTGEITTMPPPGIVLMPPFRTTDLPAVEAALDKWTRAHLPFQFETTSVLAKVTGAQQYLAAWTLDSEEEIIEAQHALRLALSELSLPLPGVTMTFAACVAVGEQVAAVRFPHVIGQMQRDFEPFVWRANDLQLVRQHEESEEWETLKTFD